MMRRGGGARDEEGRKGEHEVVGRCKADLREKGIKSNHFILSR